MFGLSTGEIMIILVLALLLLGPAKLPEAAKQIGKGLRSITRATDDVRQQMNAAMYEDEAAKQPAAKAPGAPAAAEPTVPPGGVPQHGEAVAATAHNVPGLDAALAEPAPQPAVPRPAAVSAPAPAPDDSRKA